MKVCNVLMGIFSIYSSCLMAQDVIYIHYEPECFKIFHYDLKGDITKESSLEAHTDYHLIENEGADVVFRVRESSKVRYERYLPEQGVVSCANLQEWNNDLFKQLNQREVYAYMVEQMENGAYKLMRIEEVVHMILKENYFYYEGKEINFKYYFNQTYASGEDIRLFPEGAGAAFPLGTVIEEGMTKHVIRYYAPISFKHSKFMDLYLHPNYGLVDERINQTFSKLTSVTDIKRADPQSAPISFYEETAPRKVYKEENIKNTNSDESEFFMEEQNPFKKQAANIPNRSIKTTPFTEPIKENTPKKTQAIGYESIYHTVIMGDNLYRLAQRYRTTEEELKKINGLKSNEIFLGQRLKVK